MSLLNEFKNARAYQVDNAKGVIVFGAAMGVPSSYYETLAQYFNQLGFHCYLVKSREEMGLGASRSVDFGYKELLDDFSKAVIAASNGNNGLPLIVGGHSLGGQIALLYASRNPQLISGVATLASSSPFVGGFSPKSARGIRMVCFLIPALGFMFGYFPGDKIGFAGREALRVMSDWSKLARFNQIDLSNDDFDYETALKQMKIPVAGLVFTGDDLAPKAAVENILCKMPKENYQLLIEEAKEGEKSYNHFNWVKRPQKSLMKLAPWLTAITGLSK